MSNPIRGGALLAFILKFIILGPISLVLWWLVMPYYVHYLLGPTAGLVLRHVLHHTVDSIYATGAGLQGAEGVLNTGLGLHLILDGHDFEIKIALLVTNVAPYIALIFCTPAITIMRRMKILAMGLFILFVAHVVFFSMNFLSFVATMSELSTGVAQFLLTLPFILWVALAYWDKLTAYIEDAMGSPKVTKKPEPKS